jgi:xanthine/uracil permease
MKIGAAVLLIGMFIYLLPAAKHWIKHGERGNAKQWLNAAFILGLVVLFVLLLMMVV